MPEPKPINHGTNYAYTKRRCRCDECRAAHSEWARIDAERHPDRIKEQKRKQWAKPEAKATRARYIKENREKVLEWKRASWHRNGDANRAKLRARYAADPEWYARRARAYRDANPDMEYGWALKKKYGLSLEDYYLMLAGQEGRCAICGDEFGEIRKHIHVDHNHETGEVRGLLCQACNVSIGRMREDANVLRKAAEYLEKYT